MIINELFDGGTHPCCHLCPWETSANKCDLRLSHAHLRAGGCVNSYHVAGRWLLAIGIRSLTPSLLQSQESSRPGLKAIKARPS